MVDFQPQTTMMPPAVNNKLSYLDNGVNQTNKTKTTEVTSIES